MKKLVQLLVPALLTLALAGTGSMAPMSKAKPPRGETCPGAFDISRLAGYYECTPEACNQWCIEDGGSSSIADVWISWGICACKCCP